MIREQQGDGKPCNETEEVHPCNTQSCTDCELSDFGYWTDCDKPCGGGKKKRYRTIINQPSVDGKPCKETEQVLQCNTQKCITPFLLK